MLSANIAASQNRSRYPRTRKIVGEGNVERAVPSDSEGTLLFICRASEFAFVNDFTCDIYQLFPVTKVDFEGRRAAEAVLLVVYIVNKL